MYSMKRMWWLTYLTAICMLSILLVIACSACAHTQGTGSCFLPSLGEDALVTDTFYGLLLWDNKALFNNCWGMDLLPDPDPAYSMVCYDPAKDICG